MVFGFWFSVFSFLTWRVTHSRCGPNRDLTTPLGENFGRASTFVHSRVVERGGVYPGRPSLGSNHPFLNQAQIRITSRVVSICDDWLYRGQTTRLSREALAETTCLFQKSEAFENEI